MHRSPEDFLQNSDTTFYGPATVASRNGITNQRSIMELARRATMAGIAVSMSVSLISANARAEDDSIVMRIPGAVVAQALTSPAVAAATLDDLMILNIVPQSSPVMRTPERVKPRFPIPQDDQHMCPSTPEEACSFKP